MYHYWGFGLNIESEIEFPEFLPSAFDKADLTIIISTTPVELFGEGVIKLGSMMASSQEYLLNVKDIASYYAHNGNKIIIDPLQNSDWGTIRLFMLSNAMAAILYQQNKIPFHASGVILNEKLVLFTGPSGIGKSTLVFSLMQQGFRLFTDDVCVFSKNELTNEIEAIASYPMMKLWENTLDKMPHQDENRSFKLAHYTSKYGVFKKEEFSTKAYPVSRIYVLRKDDNATQTLIRKLSPLESFNELQQNTYRRMQVDLSKLHQTHFSQILQLTHQVEVFEVIRNASEDNIPRFANTIQQHFTS